MSHYPVAGYLIELAKDCLVIRELNWDTFAWNGTCVIRAQDVAAVQIFEAHDWPIIAANDLGLVAKTSLRVTGDAFRAVAERYLCAGDLVQIEQEGIHPGDMFLCEVLRLSWNGIETRSYDRRLRSFEETNMLYREITKVTFEDGYSKAATVALCASKRTSSVARKR